MACCMMYRGGLDVLGCWAVVASPKVCRRYHNVYGKIMRKSFEMSCFLIFHVKITRDMQRCSQLGISCEEMWCQRMWTQQWPPSRPNAPFSSWIGAPLASSVASTISHLLQLARSKKKDHEFWEIFWNYPSLGNVSISCMNIKVVLISFSDGHPGTNQGGSWRRFGQGHARLLHDFELHGASGRTFSQRGLVVIPGIGNIVNVVNVCERFTTDLRSGYVKIAIENDHRVHGFSH